MIFFLLGCLAYGADWFHGPWPNYFGGDFSLFGGDCMILMIMCCAGCGFVPPPGCPLEQRDLQDLQAMERARLWKMLITKA